MILDLLRRPFRRRVFMILGSTSAGDMLQPLMQGGTGGQRSDTNVALLRSSPRARMAQST
jgi:hypothetical protein